MTDNAGTLIIGGGIGGLTLALCLHQLGLPCTVVEATADIQPIGVGINVLPHAVKVLAGLGLEQPLLEAGVETSAHLFFTRHGQQVYGEPRGRRAGYDVPQISIHRGHLHRLLLDAVRERIGAHRLLLGYRCTGVEQDATGVTAHFADASGTVLPAIRATVAVGADGVHSVVRRQLVPGEPPPKYLGINMWRGVTRRPPFLDGATMVHIGWYATGCMVIYPIRNAVDAEGNQLINWLAQLETPLHDERRWDRRGRLEDFFSHFESFVYDWLNVPEMILAADMILEYPMLDQDPLPRWTEGRLTLLGDAAHPMVPRGSNGSGQAILDARCLADALAATTDQPAALQAYEAVRRPATTEVVLTNRRNPPDTVLREVYERTGDQPFDRLEEVIAPGDLARIIQNYKVTAGFDLDSLRRPPSAAA